MPTADHTPSRRHVTSKSSSDSKRIHMYKTLYTSKMAISAMPTDSAAFSRYKSDARDADTEISFV